MISTFGTRLSTSTFVSTTDFQYSFFKSLHKGKGGTCAEHVISYTSERNYIANTGSNYYSRPPKATSAFHPLGFFGLINAEGGSYFRPEPGSGRAMDFLNGTDGNGALRLPAVGIETPSAYSQVLNLSEKNKFIFPPGAVGKPSLTLNTKTGIVTGSITTHDRTRSLRGIVTFISGLPRLIGQAKGHTQNTAFFVNAP